MSLVCILRCLSCSLVCSDRFLRILFWIQLFDTLLEDGVTFSSWHQTLTSTESYDEILLSLSCFITGVNKDIAPCTQQVPLPRSCFINLVGFLRRGKTQFGRTFLCRTTGL